jgi:ketosteroid isomerase-like protein
MSEAAEVVRRLWELMEARDWDGARALLHDDFQCEWPHTGERIRAPDDFIELNRNYPEPWAIEVRRVVGEDEWAAADVAVSHPGGIARAASFCRLRDGLIDRAIDLWVDERSAASPEWRARWVERA